MSDNNLQYIGTIIRAHGVRGEGFLSTEESVPTLRQGTHVQLGFSSSRTKGYTIASLKPYKHNAIIKLLGIDTIEAISPLFEQGVFVDKSIIPDNELIQFSENIIGCSVLNHSDSSMLGTLIDVIQLPAYKGYIVETPDREEVIVPVVDEFINSVDRVKKVIRISPPEGMFQ